MVDSGPKASTEQIPAGRRCSGNGWATFPERPRPTASLKRVPTCSRLCNKRRYGRSRQSAPWQSPRGVSFVSSSIDHDDREVILNNAIVSPLIPAASDARGWTQILARYRAPSLARSIIELVITAGPFVLLWPLMWATLDLGYWVCLLLAAPAAGFLVRLFMIQHDCGHGAFFHRRLANDWVGRVIGVFTLTPYDFWRRTHAIHHSTSGNLDRRGIGDIDTLTVHEYLAPLAVGSIALPPLPAPDHHVRLRPSLSVHRAAPAAGRPHARAVGSSGSALWRPTSPSRLSSPR